MGSRCQNLVTSGGHAAVELVGASERQSIYDAQTKITGRSLTSSPTSREVVNRWWFSKVKVRVRLVVTERPTVYRAKAAGSAE